jgi:hypothetical protein
LGGVSIFSVVIENTPDSLFLFGSVIQQLEQKTC